MVPEWCFRKMERGEINIDPIQREFFTAEALVRETIQNSLDAAREGCKVHVRFWENQIKTKTSTIATNKQLFIPVRLYQKSKIKRGAMVIFFRWRGSISTM